MKRLLTIALTLMPLMAVSQDTIKPLNLEYTSGIELDSISRPGGQFIFKQLCTTLIDSIIKSGDITFPRSTVGQIKNCTYKFQIRQDSLTAIIITTTKRKNTNQVIAQTSEQFGQPIETINNGAVTYEWTSSATGGGQLTAIMKTIMNQKISTLTIKKSK
jgi:hypothetical protein